MNVEVAGKKIAVRYVPLDSLGSYDHNAATICIDEKIKGTQLAVDTLLHELVHAAFGVTGMADALGDSLEEAVTVCVEQVYLPAARKLLTRLGEEC